MTNEKEIANTGARMRYWIYLKVDRVMFSPLARQVNSRSLYAITTTYLKNVAIIVNDNKSNFQNNKWVGTYISYF